MTQDEKLAAKSTPGSEFTHSKIDVTPLINTSIVTRRLMSQNSATELESISEQIGHNRAVGRRHSTTDWRVPELPSYDRQLSGERSAHDNTRSQSSPRISDESEVPGYDGDLDAGHRQRWVNTYGTFGAWFSITNVYTYLSIELESTGLTMDEPIM